MQRKHVASFKKALSLTTAIMLVACSSSTGVDSAVKKQLKDKRIPINNPGGSGSPLSFNSNIGTENLITKVSATVQDDGQRRRPINQFAALQFQNVGYALNIAAPQYLAYGHAPMPPEAYQAQPAMTLARENAPSYPEMTYASANLQTVANLQMSQINAPIEEDSYSDNLNETGTEMAQEFADIKNVSVEEVVDPQTVLETPYVPTEPAKKVKRSKFSKSEVNSKARRVSKKPHISYKPKAVAVIKRDDDREEIGEGDYSPPSSVRETTPIAENANLNGNNVTDTIKSTTKTAYGAITTGASKTVKFLKENTIGRFTAKKTNYPSLADVPQKPATELTPANAGKVAKSLKNDANAQKLIKNSLEKRADGHEVSAFSETIPSNM